MGNPESTIRVEEFARERQSEEKLSRRPDSVDFKKALYLKSGEKMEILKCTLSGLKYL